MRVTSLFGPSTACRSKLHTIPAGKTYVCGVDGTLVGGAAEAAVGARAMSNPATMIANRAPPALRRRSRIPDIGLPSLGRAPRRPRANDRRGLPRHASSIPLLARGDSATTPLRSTGYQQSQPDMPQVPRIQQG